MKIQEIPNVVDYKIGQYEHYLKFFRWDENTNTWQTDHEYYLTCDGFLRQFPEFDNAEVVGIIPESTTALQIYLRK